MKLNFSNEANNNLLIYNLKSPTVKNQNNIENNNYSTTLMKNCGFDPIFFNDIQKYVYIYKKNPNHSIFCFLHIPYLLIFVPYYIHILQFQ